MDPVIYSSGEHPGKNDDNEDQPQAPAEAPETQPVDNEKTIETSSPESRIPLGVPDTVPLTSHPIKKNKIGPSLITSLALFLLIAGGWFFFLKGESKQTPATADKASNGLSSLKIGTDVHPLNAFYPDPNFLGAGAYAVNFQIYEGLVGFKNGNSVVPLLASSWTNPDNTTWVFAIKSNVKLHSGKLLTVEDVKRSFERAKTSKMPSLFASTVDTVTVKDSSHVEIKTKGPDPIFLTKIAFIYIQGEDKVNGVPDGTGAYLLDPSAKPTEHDVKLVAFSGYHNNKPVVQTAEYAAFDTTEKLQKALDGKQVDITDVFVNQSYNKSAPDGYRQLTFPSGDAPIIGINTTDTKSPLSKKLVRQALQLSLDPAKAATAAGRKGRLLSQITIPENFGYDPLLQPITRDVAQAKALLKQAGYPNGVTLKFEHSPTTSKYFDVFKADAAEAGITLVDNSVSNIDTLYNDIDNGKTQLYQLTVSSALIDSYDIFLSNFQTKNYNNSAFNALLNKSNQTFTATERKRLLQEASKFLVDDVAAIPLVNPEQFAYVRDTINFENTDIPGPSAVGYIRNITGR